MRDMARRLGAVLCTLALGCPIPLPDRAVTQPGATFVIRDEGGLAIAGAELLLVVGSDPHDKLESTHSFTADAEGRVVVERVVDTRMVFPLMMHGVPFYYYEWCASAPGFVAKTGSLKDDAGEIGITLVRGDKHGHCTEDSGHAIVRDDRKAPPSDVKAPEPAGTPSGR